MANGATKILLACLFVLSIAPPAAAEDPVIHTKLTLAQQSPDCMRVRRGGITGRDTSSAEARHQGAHRKQPAAPA